MSRDLLSSLFLVALSLGLWFYTGSFPALEGGYPGPSLFPRIIAMCFGVAGLMLGARALRRTRPKVATDAAWTPAGMVRLGVGLALVCAYPILAQSIHFVPVMGGLILIFALLLRNPAWHALFMALLSAGLIYLMFTQLLGVPL